MSIGPMGALPASAAGSQLAQTAGPDVERTQQETSSQQRRVFSEKKAESAAGVGETDGEDHETADRDADGRRMWEAPPEGEHSDSQSENNGPKSKDASGQAGNQLDLSG